MQTVVNWKGIKQKHKDGPSTEGQCNDIADHKQDRVPRGNILPDCTSVACGKGEALREIDKANIFKDTFEPPTRRVA